MTPTPLLDRIEKKYRTAPLDYCPGTAGHDPNTGPGSDYCTACGRYAAKVLPFRPRRKPVWIERMQSAGLPPKDYTEGPDAA